EGAAAVLEVAADAAEDADVGGGVDEELQIDLRAQALVDEDEDAFDDDDRPGLDRDRLLAAAVGLEVVDRHRDGLAGLEPLDVLDQELGLERVGVVEVQLAALL